MGDEEAVPAALAQEIGRAAVGGDHAFLDQAMGAGLVGLLDAADLTVLVQADAVVGPVLVHQGIGLTPLPQHAPYRLELVQAFEGGIIKGLDLLIRTVLKKRRDALVGQLGS